MSYRFLSRVALTTTLLASVLVAQRPPKPPTLSTRLQVGKTLDVAIEHRAIAWTDTAAAVSVGSLRTKRPIHLGGRSLAKGTFKLTISKTADGLWQLALSPKKKVDPTPSWVLSSPSKVPRALSGPSKAEQPSARPLLISCRLDTAQQASLRIEFGPIDTSLALAATATLEAVLAADPAIRGIDAQVARANAGGADNWRSQMPKPSVVEFDPDHEYLWHLSTNRGSITIRFFPDSAPMHVTSTIYLTRAGFYDGLGFHRVITGFMAQGGCPLRTGSGSCGYKYAGEFDPRRKHDRPGLLSMANAGPGTDDCQFFITFAPTPHLDGKHTLFGEVVRGMDVVRQLEAAGSKSGDTSARLTIETASVSVR